MTSLVVLSHHHNRGAVRRLTQAMKTVVNDGLARMPPTGRAMTDEMTPRGVDVDGSHEPYHKR